MKKRYKRYNLTTRQKRQSSVRARRYLCDKLSVGGLHASLEPQSVAQMYGHQSAKLVELISILDPVDRAASPNKDVCLLTHRQYALR